MGCVFMYTRRPYKPRRRYKPHRRYNFAFVGLIFVAIVIIFAGYIFAAPVMGFLKGLNYKTETDKKSSNLSSLPTQTEHYNELKNINGIFIPASSLTAEGINSIISMKKDSGINTIVINMKNEDGLLYYQSQNDIAKKYNLISENAVEIQSVLEKLQNAGIYTIAKISCFKDNTLPKRQYLYSVPLAGGGMWWNTFCWINPYYQPGLDYLYSIANELSDYGFDEIMLDEVKFPDSGRLELLDYGEALQTKAKPEALTDFINTMYDKIHSKGKKLSLSIPAIGAYSDMVNIESGQSFNWSNLKIDYLSPYFQPSEMAGPYSIPVTIANTLYQNIEQDPQTIIDAAIKETQKRLNSVSSKIVLRPWLQDYAAGSKPYTITEIQSQIYACKNNGINNYLFYNPKGEYTSGAYANNLNN